MIDAFTGGDESIERGLYDRAAELRVEHGEPIPNLVGFMRKALGK